VGVSEVVEVSVGVRVGEKLGVGVSEVVKVPVGEGVGDGVRVAVAVPLHEGNIGCARPAVGQEAKQSHGVATELPGGQKYPGAQSVKLLVVEL